MNEQRNDRNAGKGNNENPTRVSRKFIRIFYNLCLVAALIVTILSSMMISTAFDNDLSVVMPIASILFLALIGIAIIMNVSMTCYFQKHPVKDGLRSTLDKRERAAIAGLIFGTISMAIAFGYLLISL